MPYTSITKPPIGTATRKSIIDALIDNQEYFNGNISVSSRINMIPNGSFEEISGTLPLKWNITNYSGGSSAIDSANSADGQYSLRFTSSSVANGGGDAVTEDYIPVISTEYYYWSIFRGASAAGISCRVNLDWYDSSKTYISTTTVLSETSSPTTLTLSEGTAAAPSSAKFVRVKLVGGVPGTGTATGSIYFDAVQLLRTSSGINFRLMTAVAGTTYIVFRSDSQVINNIGTWKKVKEVRVPEGGSFNVYYEARTDSSGILTNIYVNDVPVGTIRNVTSTSYVQYSENITGINPGDLIQIYANDQAATTAFVRNFRLRVSSTGIMYASTD